jgi:hypothetical protein
MVLCPAVADGMSARDEEEGIQVVAANEIIEVI